MKSIKDWIWCAYTPGAGGKMMCSILQLDSKTHTWHIELDSKLDTFINEKIKISDYDHMKNEPHWPYNLSWYTRQLPFTRGDEFTTEEAEHLFSKHNNNFIKKDMKLLLYKNFIMHWCKPYLPNWFKGQALQIVNDKESLEFLKKRRDVIFYEWKDNLVYQKRFITNHIFRPNQVHNYDKNEVKTVERFDSIEKFYKQEFYSNPEVKGFFSPSNDSRIKLHLNLSDIWSRGAGFITEKINYAFDFDIDEKKVKLIIDAWVENNKKFL